MSLAAILIAILMILAAMLMTLVAIFTRMSVPVRVPVPIKKSCLSMRQGIPFMITNYTIQSTL